MTSIAATTTCPEWCEGQHDEEPRHEAPALNLLVSEFVPEDADVWLHLQLTERVPVGGSCSSVDVVTVQRVGQLERVPAGRSDAVPCVEIRYGGMVLPVSVRELRKLAMACLTVADVADAPAVGLDEAFVDLESFLAQVGR